MGKYIARSDLIEGLFSEFSVEDCYVGDRISLQAEICKVIKKIPELRGKFHFEMDGTFPRSEELGAALVALRGSKISLDNPWLQVLRVKECLKKEFDEEIAPHLEGDLANQLRAASKELARRLRKPTKV